MMQHVLLNSGGGGFEEIANTNLQDANVNDKSPKFTFYDAYLHMLQCGDISEWASAYNHIFFIFICSLDLFVFIFMQPANTLYTTRTPSISHVCICGLILLWTFWLRRNYLLVLVHLFIPGEGATCICLFNIQAKRYIS